MEFHEKASIFPLMEGDEFEALVADIATHGQIEPILLYEGKVLDGRNRWRACERLGLAPVMQEWNGDDPEALVISLNLVRRHLSREQRDQLIRMKRIQGWTLQKIADTTGVSYGTAHNVARDVIINSDIENERGQMRPAQYAPREERPEPPPHVSFNSGNNEWYTPVEYITAARAVMGGIDLDPASSDLANEIVGAATYYTKEDDGLQYRWQGRVWMNPPYASNLIGSFAEKLAAHVRRDEVTEACVLVNNATETAWFGAMLDVAACVCFPRGRVRFIDEIGNPSGAPLQGQAILYMGQNVGAFARIFAKFGTVLYARRDT